MSGASHSRAAVFTSSAQSVEIYERGAWWPGRMLGWRHDNGGSCQAWVRVEFAGVVEDAWVDLTLLRLPEPGVDRRLVLAREPRAASAVGRGDVRSQRVEQAAEVAPTRHLPLVGGGALPVGSRMPSVGGRRRAAEAEEPLAPAGVLPAARGRALGRHRAPAPADAGRHRAAETGVFAAVPAGTASPAAVDQWAPQPRTELPPAGPVVRPASAHPQPAGDLLTRPMRLEEGVGHARRTRRDVRTGV